MLYDECTFYTFLVNSIKAVLALEVMMHHFCGGEAGEACMSRFFDCAAIYTEWHTKNGNFWKTQQKLKKSKKKKLLTEVEPLQLAF